MAKTVTVYVRRPEDARSNDRADGVRELRFQPPEDISPEDLLNAGFAIDGNTAMRAVQGFNKGYNDYVPLAKVLNGAQKELVQFLANEGYDVEFK